MRYHSTYKGIKIYKNIFGIYECSIAICTNFETLLNHIDNA